MSNKKIVFCGCGPMGEGILGGLLNNNVAKAKDVTVNELLEVRRTILRRRTVSPPSRTRLTR